MAVRCVISNQLKKCASGTRYRRISFFFSFRQEAGGRALMVGNPRFARSEPGLPYDGIFEFHPVDHPGSDLRSDRHVHPDEGFISSSK